MIETNNSMPFNIVFLDEPLPECFNQPEGMTYKDLLSVVGREFKNTYSHRKRKTKGQANHSRKTIEQTRNDILSEIQENLGEDEYKRFLSVFHDLAQEIDYQALKSSRYIGISSNATQKHIGANNLLEWVFGRDGRIDACFIQKDGVKFIFVIGVRSSNHSDKKDDPINDQKRDIAKLISNAFDSKNGNDPEGVFKSGLLAYQHELLQNTNTVSAQFETLLITLEQLIVSQEPTQDKIDSFKRDFASCLRHVNKDDFDKYIQERLENGPIKQYQKELFEKLYHYEYGNNQLNEEIENSFAGIHLVKRDAVAFFNLALDLINKTDDEGSEIENQEKLLSCFRYFHKMLPSHIYVLEEMLDESCSEIEESLKTKLKHFVSALIELKTKYHPVDKKTPFVYFQEILQNVKESKFLGLTDGMEKLSTNKNPYVDLLNIDILDISREESVDKIADAFIKFIIEEEEYNSLSEFVSEHSSLIHRSNRNSLYRKIKNPDGSFVLFFNKIFENEKTANQVWEKYPFLKEYVNQIQQNTFSKLDQLHSVCEYYAIYAITGDEEFFVEANKVLMEMSPEKRELLKAYLASSYMSESENIFELAVGSLDIANQLLVIEKLKEKQMHAKEKQTAIKQQVLTVQHMGQEEMQSTRFEFERFFSEFLMDTENPVLIETLEKKAQDLTKDDLNKLEHSEGEIGEFIKDYKNYRSQKKKPAFNSLITNMQKRETEKRRKSFEIALENYFTSLDREKVRHELCSVCLSLETSDVEYFLTEWQKSPTKNELKILFLETYKKSSFDNAMKRTDDRIGNEKKEVFNKFEEKYQSFMSEPSEKNVADFAKFLMGLSEIDIDMILFVQEHMGNVTEYSLLKMVNGCRNKSPKKALEEIKNNICCVFRREDFRKSLGIYLYEGSTEEQKKSLMQSISNLNKSDIDTFFNDNSGRPPFKLFFAKLRRSVNNLKSKTFEPQLSELIDATCRRLNFYNTLFEFISSADSESEKLDSFVDAYMQLTAQDQKDIENEHSNSLLIPVVLNRLNSVNKESKGDKNQIKEFLKENKWEQYFYYNFDSLRREEGDFVTREAHFAFAMYLSELTYNQAYQMLLQKEPKKPRILNIGLKERCFYEAFLETLKDKSNDEKKDKLCQIIELFTISDLDYVGKRVTNDQMYHFVIDLDFDFRRVSSQKEKKEVAQRAVSKLVSQVNTSDFRNINFGDVWGRNRRFQRN